MKLIYRCHKGSQTSYKSCYVQAEEGKVIATEEPMNFAVGWTVQKLRERAIGKGYTLTLQVGLSEIPKSLAWSAASASSRKKVPRRERRPQHDA